MPNKNYLRGRRWEYEIIEKLNKTASQESWGQRMAGSHSPYDIIHFDPSLQRITLVQGKTKKGKEGVPAITEYKEMEGWKIVTYRWTKFIK